MRSALALTRAVRGDGLAHPVHRDDNGILIDGLLLVVLRPLRLGMLDEVQVLRIEEVADRSRGAEVRVVVEDDLSRLVHQLLEAERRARRLHVALVALQRPLVERVVVVRQNDQVRLVVAEHAAQPELVEHRTDVRRARSARVFEELILPEREGRRVDAADRAGARRVHQRGKPADLVGQRAVRVEIDGEVVAGGVLRIGDAGLHQLDHRLLAVVLPKLAPGSRHMEGDLRPVVLGRADHVGSVDVQRVVAGIALVGAVLGVLERQGDLVAAAFGLDVAVRLQLAQEGVVVTDVVHDIPRVIAQGGGHHLRERAVRRGHWLVLSSRRRDARFR
jgi:hypothetical protein